MSTQSQAFTKDLRAYIQEQEKAPLYGKSFFEGVMAGTMNREALKKWAIQHHYRTGQHIRAFGGIFLNTGLSPLDQKTRGQAWLVISAQENGLAMYGHRFLGLELDSKAMEACLPAEKLDYLRDLLDSWDLRSKCLRKEIQELMGFLQLCIQVIYKQSLDGAIYGSTAT